MVRAMVAVALAGVLVCASFADEKDKDPIKERLFAAKKEYDAEMKAYRAAAEAWFDKREEAARKDGNKKLLDQVKAERDTFDESGALPKGVPAAIPQKAVSAKKGLEIAYELAVKEYTKAKKDDAAAAVEKEWKAFAAKANSINLLALIDLKTHTVSGSWKKDGKALVGSPTDKAAVLQLPYEPGEEYDLEITCRRIAGNEGLAIGLVAGGRQVAAVIDGWPNDGYRSGFEHVDKKSGRDNVTTVKGAFFMPDTDSAITCSICSGKIEVSANDKLVISFKGNSNRLSSPEGWGGANKKALYLHFSADFKFDRIVVTPVKGKGTIIK